MRAGSRPGRQARGDSCGRTTYEDYRKGLNVILTVNLIEVGEERLVAIDAPPDNVKAFPYLAINPGRVLLSPVGLELLQQEFLQLLVKFLRDGYMESCAGNDSGR